MSDAPQSILVTGAAGFIGSHVSQALLQRGCRVIGVDNFNTFYAPQIKRSNAEELAHDNRFGLHELDIRDRDAILNTFKAAKPDAVIHLAAMAGVRPSIEDPALYTAVNLDGTVNLLDAAVASGVSRFVFASSSSVYGNNKKVPFAEIDPVDEPISPYAATKRAGELICHTYWHLHHLPIFCLRFFTVFGPRQRPDLAIAKFIRAISEGKSIPVFGDGSTSRDYTFVHDIVAGILAALDRCDRYRIYNLGGHDPVTLTQMIQTIERVVGRDAIIDRKPMQPGDVDRTYADITRAQQELGYSPSTDFESGIRAQWQWYQQFVPAQISRD
ncbi:NAD-dependent epimerase/dehydratase family protein [Planctomycetales bacterium ZRK34]|nr:NAD-dependent epimerase/dehydratase family protein [Planctomycetales bacterium ZRK34]